jgi:hypothetical protein
MTIKTNYKSILFIAIFCCLNLNAYCQFYFGGTKNETIKKINLDYNDAKLLNENSDSIEYDIPSIDALIKVFFNQKNVANMNVLLPLSQESLNKWVKTFNSTCVPKSDIEWTSYTGGNVINYRLFFKDNSYFFVIFTNSKNEQ